MINLNKTLYLTKDGSYTVYNSKYKEHYHSLHGAFQESKHVFINNGILHLLETKPSQLNVLEVGFGTGLNALLTIDFSEFYGIKINYTALEPYPLNEQIIEELNYFNHFNFVEKRKSQYSSMHNCNWELPCNISPFFSLTKSNLKIQRRK